MPKALLTEAQKREQTTIRLPAELKMQIQQEADGRGESLNGMLMIMLNKAWELMSLGQL